MPQQPIRFDNGAAYERGMGVWSQLAGTVFLDWIAPADGQTWIDIGCGNGAFTELLVQRHAPAEVQGIDPSDAQIAFARTRPAAAKATFQPGDAMALPFDENRFDAAIMALVIFFVPDPAKGVAEMARVVRPGGIVAAYAWDMAGGGFPFEPLRAEMRSVGIEPSSPPSSDASRIEILRRLWLDAGLEMIETRQIEVQRTFASFDDFWDATTAMGSTRPALAALPPSELEAMKTRLRARLPADGQGRITYGARANAIKGRVPA